MEKLPLFGIIDLTITTMALRMKIFNPYRFSGYVVCLFFALFTSVSSAKEVSVKHNNLTLLGEFTQAAKDKKKPLVLLVHGTIAHGKMEIIKSLQSLLKQKGFNSLAITLSLNVNKRRGMYACDKLHTHKHDDALPEINAWTNWLSKKGYKNIVLTGHSRGGSQVTRYIAKFKPQAIKKLVLLAPMSATHAQIAKSYNKSSSKKLAQVLKIAESSKSTKHLKAVSFLHCSKANVTAASFLGYYKLKETDTAKLLSKLKLSVKVFAGSDDKIAAGLIAPMKQAAKSKNVELTVIDGAGHFFRDLYLEDVVDSMVDFIQKP